MRPRILALLAKGELESARQILLPLHALYAGTPDYIGDLAACYWALGKGTGAVRLMTEALSRRPGDAEGWGRLGAMYLAMGEPAAAKVAFEQAVAEAPGSGLLIAALHGRGSCRASPPRPGPVPQSAPPR